MARKRPCLDCGRLTPFSRCEECGRAHVRKRDLERQKAEPWREVYGSNEWKRCRSQVMQRAAYKCEVTIYSVAHPGGKRCLRPARDAHHVQKLRDLWLAGKDPCDPALAIAVCTRCHPVVEATLEGPPAYPGPRDAA